MAVLNMKYGVWALAGLLAVAAIDAAPFEPPREGPVAFRRDRLPIDVDTMTTLSDRLVILALAQRLETPRDRRASAQMLGLALALNPANSWARETLTKASKGTALPKADKRELNRDQVQIWNAITWLESPEAGTDGQVLGTCLADVISISDPENPRAGKKEKGAWKGWIPELIAYRELPKVEAAIPDQATPVVTETKILLPAANLFTPLWTVDNTTGAESLALMKLTLAAAIIPPPATGAEPQPVVKPMTISLAPPVEDRWLSRTNRDLGKALVKHFGTLPVDSRVTLSLPEEVTYLPARNLEAISGPAAVLLASAISGQEATGTVIGRIDETGTFKMIPDFWDRLRVIGRGSGGRLVVPAEAAEILPSILALEDPEFFMKFDVLLASNLTELLARSAKTTAAPLADQLLKFQDIRVRGASIPVGQYVANRFIRQRLVDLSAEAPYYMSPKMLCIQAAGERPVRLPRKILASELRNILSPVAWISTKTSPEIDLARLDRSYEAAKAEIDRLERYVDTPDREFHVRVKDMVTSLRTFSRTSRMSVNRDNGPAAVAAAFDTMRKSYAATLEELNNAVGDAAPADPDTPPP